ncbi:ORF 46 [Macacine gammaherpesvirus 5]|nr:ORF 46 [Macacine gammaherpesvirus 5]QFN51833.1 ORF 46 [Macacine gammaherpesvirus 5]
MDTWLETVVWHKMSMIEPNETPTQMLLISDSWLKFLNLSPFLKKKLAALLKRVMDMSNVTVIYPPIDRIMWWSYCCEPEDIKVVILGQDPYHRGQATGLAFSVAPDYSIPPSLKNIFKEIANTVPGFTAPSHGCLDCWAKRGVLLLNTILTVERGKAGSHANLGWDWFTSYIISCLSAKLQRCVFMLWGRKAIDKATLINGQRHLVLKARHPSPLATAHAATGSPWPQFLGCNHFKLANDYLVQNRRGAVDWNIN